MVSFNVQPLTTLMLELTFFLSPDSFSGTLTASRRERFCFSFASHLVLSLAALAPSRQEQCSSSSASQLVFFLSASAVICQERSFSSSACCLEHFVHAHLGHLALDSQRVSAGSFLFGIMKQLFSKIYGTASTVQHTTSKSKEAQQNAV